MILEPLKPLAIPISALTPDPNNARLHSSRNLESIRQSLAQFGQRKPIVVQREGMIVRAGNGTLAAAKVLGWTEIAAVVVEEDDVQATAYALADNRTGELADWDYPVLAEVVDGLADDVPLVGWNDAELEGILETLVDLDELRDMADLGEFDDPGTAMAQGATGDAQVAFRFGSLGANLPQEVFDRFAALCTTVRGKYGHVLLEDTLEEIVGVAEDALGAHDG